MTDDGALAAVSRAFRTVKRPAILVVGDLMLDRYIWGEVLRISPEAPIQVLKVLREDARLGAAANVVRNAAALGARAVGCGVVGKDAMGRLMTDLFRQARLPTAGVFVDPDRPTTEKTRLIARSQQVLRVDREKPDGLSGAMERKILAFLRRLIPRVDGVIVSDYGKGLLTDAVLSGLIRMARRSGKFVLVDPKGNDYSRYRGATAITPNKQEAQEGSRIDLENRADLIRACRRFKRKLNLRACVITLGADGIALLDPRDHFEILPAKARSVYDVTGAGDTVIAALGVSLALGVGWREAAVLANVAAGIVVGKIGTATVTREDVLALLGGSDHHPKILAVPRLIEALKDERRRGRKIVFTNGCFDLLHVGHVRLLDRARSAGDLLVVGLNTDRSVRRMKGPGRPLVAQRERARVLASMHCVDYVAFFDEATPARMIRRLRPDILVKGEDWRGKGVVGRRFVESYGGRVELVKLVPDRSTTDLVRKISGGVA